MARLIGSVVLGYVAMFVAVFVGLTGAWLAMGAERAFRPGVFEVSPLWAGVSLLVGLAAALLGGWVSRTVAKRPLGPQVLAGVVVVLGLVMAFAAAAAGADASGVREAGLPMMEAIQNARTPLWVQIANTVVGAVGVLIGGRALARDAADARPATPGAVAG